ncbi:hypothetical protein M8R20_00270 [Pseudomonas sp. R2.Fl]|nr:hypothetical protein [Pseudomonas sp. R2.Fl]
MTVSVALLVAALAAAGGYWLGNGGLETVTPAIAQAQVQEQGQEQPGPGTTGRVGNVAAPPENAIVKQAREWGVTTCSRQVTDVSNFLTAGAVYSSNTVGGREKPDRQMFSAVIAARVPATGIVSWSSMTVAPVDEGCNLAYQTVMYFQRNCPAVRSEHFSNFANRIEFGDLAELYSNESREASLYLMPTAGEGCIAIKSQILY